MMNLDALRERHLEAATFATNLEAKLRNAATADGRALGPSEIEQVNRAVQTANDLRSQITRRQSDAAMTAEINRITAGMPAQPTRSGAAHGGGLGAQFLGSETFRWMQQHKGSLPTGAWTSPASELSGFGQPPTLMATTLTEDSGSGGALVVPDHRPGVLPLPTRPLTMADLIAPGTTDSNLVTYMAETTFTNSADTVAEGAAKPESTLVFTATSDPVRKIATWLPVTEEMLEDVPALGSYVDTRLRLAVNLAEDDQLLNGTTTAPDIVGFLNRTGLATAQARGTDSNADAVLKQIAAIQTATNLVVSGIVMNPTNWLTIMLAKLATGEYVSGNGPFNSPQVPILWGRPVALTSAITLGTALVGAFQTGAQFFRKGGMRVEASNSHASFFVENKVAIRSETRGALAVYRPSAFGTVTGLN